MKLVASLVVIQKGIVSVGKAIQRLKAEMVYGVWCMVYAVCCSRCSAGGAV